MTIDTNLNTNEKTDTQTIANEAHECFKYGVRCIIWSKDYKEALKCFDKAISLQSDKSDYYYWRGTAHKHFRHYSKAIEDFTKALELNPESLNTQKIYNERGISYGYLGQFENALANFNKAIELFPDSAETYDNRGITYINMKEFQKALDDFNKAIELNPENTTYQKDKDAALKFLKENQ